MSIQVVQNNGLPHRAPQPNSHDQMCHRDVL